MAVTAFAEHDNESRSDQTITLRHVAWSDYERLLEIRGETAVPRYTFLEGELEIMSPSRSHESIKSMMGCLIEVWCLEHEIEFTTLGSWTLKDKVAEVGLEPDECYVFGDSSEAKVPHLALEVIWNSGANFKKRAYAKLGVEELWFWAHGRIEIHALESGAYTPIEQSRVLAGINLRELERYIELPTTSQAIRAYRASLKG